MSLVVDVDVYTVDIPRLRSLFTSDAAWMEFEGCLRRALMTVCDHPEHGRECEYPPLLGYRKHKFHSQKHPTPKDKPDMRLIYEVRKDAIVVLVLGERRRKHPADVYKLVETRLPGAAQKL